MLKIGNYNNLQIVKAVDFGYYLDGGDDWGEILLPTNSAPKDCSVEDWLDVFIYFDSEDRIIATTKQPYTQVGEFNLLRTVAVESVGAFMDWGLPKDLMVPFGEQKVRLSVGRSYVVWTFLDNGTGRIVGSTRLEKFINKYPGDYEEGQEVDLIVVRETELGYKAIINNMHWGVLYHNEVFNPLDVGQKTKGFVHKMREDGKIDLVLTLPGYGKVDGIAQSILEMLEKAGGFLPVTSKTSPEDIYEQFAVSKKNYKKAIGTLYKKRLIKLEPDGVRLVK